MPLSPSNTRVNPERIPGRSLGRGLEGVAGPRLARCFGRSEGRQRARAYLRELFGSAERTNGWQVVETVGDRSPHGVQRLLGTVFSLRAKHWSTDHVCGMATFTMWGVRLGARC